MVLALVWTVIGFIGFCAALVGAYFAYGEYVEACRDFAVVENCLGNGTRQLAANEVAANGATVIRLIGFSVVLLMFVAVGIVSIFISPEATTQDLEQRRTLIALGLIVAEFIIMLIKILDLINIYRQVQARKEYGRKFNAGEEGY